MEQCSEISKVCPKCGKDYTGNPHWKQSLKRHIARKNPCDEKKEYIRDPPKKPDENGFIYVAMTEEQYEDYKAKNPRGPMKTAHNTFRYIFIHS